MGWDFDVSLSRVLTALSLLFGSVLQILHWSTSLTGPFILPLSFILLAVGVWLLIREVRETSHYEAILHNPVNPVGSFDQSGQLREVTTRLGEVEKSLAAFERLCIHDLAELKTRVEGLELLSWERTENSPQEFQGPKEEERPSTEEVLTTESEAMSEEPAKAPISPTIPEVSSSAPPPSQESETQLENASIRDGPAPSQEAIRETTKPLPKDSSAEQLEKKPAPPTKEQLASLKQKFAIEKGSLQYKDGSIYLVTSNREIKKYEWKKLGRWRDLSSSLIS